MRARRISRWSTAAALAAVAAAAGCDVEPAPAGACVAERIYHGVEVPAGLGLDARQIAALVAVYPEGRETICSGVVVADGVVVTAGHCVDPDAPGRLRVGAWDPARPEAAARSVVVHPELDVAVIFVDAAAFAGAVDPIPLHDGPVDDAWIGDQGVLAGYGRTELGEVGALRFAGEAIVAVDPVWITVHGRGRSGACGGDSGGPLLARDAAGRVRVVGLLDAGHASCLQEDHYTRVDALAAWWPFAWRAPHAVDRGCEGLGDEGTCVRGQAMRCGADGQIEVEACAGERRCGQRPGEPRFTCVAASDDACEGAGARAFCDGDALVRCEGGGVTVESCGACGLGCAAWTPGGEAGCAPADPEGGAG